MTVDSTHGRIHQSPSFPVQLTGPSEAHHYILVDIGGRQHQLIDCPRLLNEPPTRLEMQYKSTHLPTQFHILFFVYKDVGRLSEST